MIRRIVHALYAAGIRPLLPNELHQQRMKLVWDVWGYLRLLNTGTLTLKQRLYLIRRFLAVDWNVGHSHKPNEISELCRVISERPAKDSEVIVEAGCWQGGSSAKFSILADMLGYRLLIFDSFQGVEELTVEEKSRGYDFSGEYASPRDVLENNLDRYGVAGVCEIFPGWFCDTIAASPPPVPIRAVYIDCDTARGSANVLQGILPTLSEDGWITTQDYHIPVVKEYLMNLATWKDFGRAPAQFEHRCHNLAVARCPEPLESMTGASNPTKENVRTIA